MAEYDSKVVTGDKLKPVLDNINILQGLRIGWGICSTADAETGVTTREVTVGAKNGLSKGSFTLEKGSTVGVFFQTGIKAGDKLSVNGTAAAEIRVGGSTLGNDIAQGTFLFLTYDGSFYEIVSGGGRAVKVGGVEKIPATSTTPLDIVGEQDTSVRWDSTNNKVKISTDIGGKLNRGLTIFDSNNNVLVDVIIDYLGFKNSGNVHFSTDTVSGSTVIKAFSQYAQGHGTCSTAAATAAKTVSITDYTLVTGGIIAVYFTNAVPANATLNVTSKGAKPIFYDGIAITAGVIDAGETALLMYDGTNYNVITSSKNLPYSGQGYATCSTAAATAAKTAALAGYTLVKGGMVAVKFTNAVPASATLNINSQGAKNIRYNGNNITNGVIGKNDIALFEYDGTYYNLVVSGPGALTPVLQTIVDEIDKKQNHNLGDTNKNKVLVTDGSGNIVPSDTISTTELGYLDGLTESIKDKFSRIDDDFGQVNDDLTDTNERIDDAIKDLTVYYGTCNTAEATDAKTVAITNFTLETGRLVAVSFTYAVKAGQTLNINNTGAKAIKWGTATLLTGYINAGDTCLFRYDGTDYVLLSNAYKFPGFTISPQTSSTVLDGQWEINLDALIGHTKVNGAGIDIAIPYASRTHPGVVIVPASKTVTVDDVQKTIGNTLQIDSQGNIFLPIAGSATGNELGAVAPGVGVSVGEGGHLELNQADANNIGGMKLTNTTTSADQAKTDTTFTAYATSRLIDSKIAEAQAGAAMFKGTVGGANDTIKKDDDTTAGVTKFSTLTTYKKGWYWVVNANGTFVGQSCEIGDFIFCVNDKGNDYSASDFSVVQNNLDVITTGQVNTLWNAVFNAS